ncbi:MAG: SET domain-containing protein-lysine N-methyltransferase [Verrucomicrobiota bacterium]
MNGINTIENENVAVRKSLILHRQLGVISKKAFKKDATIFSIQGPVKEEPTKYSFSVGLDEHIEPERNDGSFDFGHYLNHSCNPNTKIKVVRYKGRLPYLKVVARRNIKAGEELTFDYASLEYVITLKNVKCQCKDASCRKYMCGFRDLPENFVKKYIKERMIPKHLLDMRSSK